MPSASKTSPSEPSKTPDASASARTPQRPPSRQAWYLLLVLPFVGMLWVPFYNRIEPKAGSIPFFYWYQFAWIGISAVLTAVVYFATRDAER